MYLMNQNYLLSQMTPWFLMFPNYHFVLKFRKNPRYQTNQLNHLYQYFLRSQKTPTTH
jgi:hypothetical protein